MFIVCIIHLRLMFYVIFVAEIDNTERFHYFVKCSDLTQYSIRNNKSEYNSATLVSRNFLLIVEAMFCNFAKIV